MRLHSSWNCCFGRYCARRRDVILRSSAGRFRFPNCPMDRWLSPSSPLQKKKRKATDGRCQHNINWNCPFPQLENADATDLQRSIQCPNQAENNGFQPLTSGNDRRNAPIGHQKETEQRRCHSADNEFFPLQKPVNECFHQSQREC